MKDGSDAIADWPLLNALLNTASGASWAIHNGGGVGIGYSSMPDKSPSPTAPTTWRTTSSASSPTTRDRRRPPC